MTVSCQLSVLLSAVGDGRPYDLHRTFHVLPLRPLCGAGVRLKFSFQGSTPFGAPASFRSFYVMQGSLPWSVFVPLTVLIVSQGFPLVKCFLKNFLIFFACLSACCLVSRGSISDYKIAHGYKFVKHYFSKNQKKYREYEMEIKWKNS